MRTEVDSSDIGHHGTRNAAPMPWGRVAAFAFAAGAAVHSAGSYFIDPKDCIRWAALAAAVAGAATVVRNSPDAGTVEKVVRFFGTGAVVCALALAVAAAPSALVAAHDWYERFRAFEMMNPTAGAAAPGVAPIPVPADAVRNGVALPPSVVKVVSSVGTTASAAFEASGSDVPAVVHKSIASTFFAPVLPTDGSFPDGGFLRFDEISGKGECIRPGFPDVVFEWARMPGERVIVDGHGWVRLKNPGDGRRRVLAEASTGFLESFATPRPR